MGEVFLTPASTILLPVSFFLSFFLGRIWEPSFRRAGLLKILSHGWLPTWCYTPLMLAWQQLVLGCLAGFSSFVAHVEICQTLNCCIGRWDSLWVPWSKMKIPKTLTKGLVFVYGYVIYWLKGRWIRRDVSCLHIVDVTPNHSFKYLGWMVTGD